MNNDSQLIDNFVATFEKVDDLSISADLNPEASKLAVGDFEEDGFSQWRPIQVATEPSALEVLYAKLPARFPPLYERLVLSYRWAEVDLGLLRLLANPPGPSVAALGEEIARDQAMQEVLVLNQCLQFGRGPDYDYDAVCFDWSRRLPDGDCPVVKIDHEEILCNRRFKIVAELAPSFRALMERVIAATAS
jgi:hypothetical protein